MFLRSRLRSATMSVAHRLQLFLSKTNRASLNALANNRALLPLQFPGSRITPKIDITLVTFNSAKWLEGFFETLCNQAYPLSHIAVYVVDHSSDNDTWNQLRAWQARIAERFAVFDIHSRPNLGFGAGQNFAIAFGAADFVLVVNPDIQFEPDTLSTIVSLAAADLPQVASWELRQKPYEHPKHYDPVTLETNWSSHACIMLRRSAWQAVGGYDELFFLYAEDVELSYRLRHAGYHLRYCPKAVVWHFSYAQPNEIKPAQYIGSIVGNLLLRLRYGTTLNKVAGLVLFAFCMIRPQPIAQGRRRLLKMLIRHAHPGTTRQKLPIERPATNVHFGFWRFDYELRRAGAFEIQQKTFTNHPLISIITRTLGTRRKLLLQAGSSVMNQSYPNIEWLVIEDGGECMKATINNFARHSPYPVRYFSLPRAGRSSAGNAGLHWANGIFVMFLDEDDLLYADHVESLWSTLEKANGCVAAYALSFSVLTKFSGEDDIEDELYTQPTYLNQPFSYEILRYHNYIPIQAILFNRSLFLERGGFDDQLDYLEDWNLWLRYAYRNRFAYLPKTTSLFRVPADPSAWLSRQKKLDGAINQAAKAAQSWCQRYDAKMASESSPSTN